MKQTQWRGTICLDRLFRYCCSIYCTVVSTVVITGSWKWSVGRCSYAFILHCCDHLNFFSSAIKRDSFFFPIMSTHCLDFSVKYSDSVQYGRSISLLVVYFQISSFANNLFSCTDHVASCNRVFVFNCHWYGTGRAPSINDVNTQSHSLVLL